MKERNERLKKNKLEKKVGKVEVSYKEEIEKKVSEESDDMWIAKNKLRSISEQIERDMYTINEKEAQSRILYEEIQRLDDSLATVNSDLMKAKHSLQVQKDGTKSTLDRAVKEKPGFEIKENSNIDLEIKLRQENKRTEFLIRAITILCKENTQLYEAINNPLQERGIKIPNDLQSEKSETHSVRSKFDN